MAAICVFGLHYKRRSSTCSSRAEYLLVEEIQANAVVSLADNIIAEYGRIPAVASLFVVGLLT